MASKVRIAIAALTLSGSALVGLLARENYVETATIPVRGDVPTNGFGATTREDGSPVRLGDKTSPVRALVKAQRDVEVKEAAIKRCVHVPLTQGEYDVYVDLVYNIGQKNFCTNPATGGPGVIPRNLNAGNYIGACNAILQYKRGPNNFDCSTPGNKVCSGVWTRRLEANKACLAAQP